MENFKLSPADVLNCYTKSTASNDYLRVWDGIVIS